MSEDEERAYSSECVCKDSTIPLLLGSKRAVDVIRKFKSVEKEEARTARAARATKHRCSIAAAAKASLMVLI